MTEEKRHLREYIHATKQWQEALSRERDAHGLLMFLMGLLAGVILGYVHAKGLVL